MTNIELKTEVQKMLNVTSAEDFDSPELLAEDISSHIESRGVTLTIEQESIIGEACEEFFQKENAWIAFRK